jgi:SagB-type dehydrogenase family enzyme
MSIDWTRRTVLGVATTALSALFGSGFGAAEPRAQAREEEQLPSPVRTGSVSVEAAIASRRSRREFTDEPLTPAEVGQLLWATQGITDPASGHRAAPSAGAKYPLEVYVVIGEDGVETIDPGVYHYRPEPHTLALVRAGDVQAELREAALGQEWVGDGALDVVITGVDERTVERYGERGRLRYVPMEAGHAGENLALQAEALDLSTVSIGAFRDDDVRALLDASEDERPLYIFPVGNRPRT